jgi:TolA-binding protein
MIKRIIGLVWILGLLVAWSSAEAAGRDRYADRSPVVPVAETSTEAAEPEGESIEEVVETPRAPARELTLEEKVEELQDDVDRLLRMVDPDNRRDERRLENRLRELESAVDSLRNEVRRLETMVRR